MSVSAIIRDSSRNQHRGLVNSFLRRSSRLRTLLYGENSSSRYRHILRLLTGPVTRRKENRSRIRRTPGLHTKRISRAIALPTHFQVHKLSLQFAAVAFSLTVQGQSRMNIPPSPLVGTPKPTASWMAAIFRSVQQEQSFNRNLRPLVLEERPTCPPLPLQLSSPDKVCFAAYDYLTFRNPDLAGCGDKYFHAPSSSRLDKEVSTSQSRCVESPTSPHSASSQRAGAQTDHAADYPSSIPKPVPCCCHYGETASSSTERASSSANSRLHSF
jgi:hypothetical protein